jgi:RNA polymerase sigma factor (sigma-70 family)
MNQEIIDLLEHVSKCESAGAEARGMGNESAAEILFRDAYRFVSGATRLIEDSEPDRLGILRISARLALRCGNPGLARQWINEALTTEPSITNNQDWAELCNENDWTDEWLLAAVRREPPDDAALDVLVQRHWKVLFGRCRMLTLSHPDAADLAQSTWCRVLQARQRLNPGKCFGAYLAVIATNLWRDSLRSALRAGPLAEYRLVSLNRDVPGDDESAATLMDTLPDLPASHERSRRQLAIDIDQALAKLTPRLREVLVARFITGESCAEIGRRHGRTEQTISGWVRAAVRKMRRHFKEPKFAASENGNSKM